MGDNSMGEVDEKRGEEYEAVHVHAVYQQIASHFSSTRYKPWPIVEQFLNNLPDGSIGLDIGCGNGKYLAVNPNVFIIASDRSTELANIAATQQPHSTIVADSLALPHPPATFDFAISIAVIHHFSTLERRVAAVKSILELLKPPVAANEPISECVHGGKALLYVWALEQKDSRRGWREGQPQDVMVPWVLKTGVEKRDKKDGRSAKSVTAGTIENTEDHSNQCCNTSSKSDRTPPAQSQHSKESPINVFHRYYHLYAKGELEDNIVMAGGTVIDSGYEKDNWWAIIERS